MFSSPPSTSPAHARESFDRDTLVAALRAWGVGFLGPADARPGEIPIAPEDLVGALATHTDPRLRSALVTLLVRHPEWADDVARLVLALDDVTGDAVKRAYTAAACLQRMWSPRLALYRADLPRLPDLYSEELGLPSPDERFGKVCLHALAARSPFNLLSSYDGMMAQLFWQLRIEERETSLAPAG